jgi:hypothetical protein
MTVCGRQRLHFRLLIVIDDDACCCGTAGVKDDMAGSGDAERLTDRDQRPGIRDQKSAAALN